MSPTTLHKFPASGDPSPYLREQARMQASTASACLRRLSDCVNSVRSCQAASLLGISFIFILPTSPYVLVDPSAPLSLSATGTYQLREGTSHRLPRVT